MTAAGRVLAEHRMSRRGRAVAWGLVLLGVLVLVVAVRRPSDEGVALDPDGTGTLGAKALVLLLREGNADVRVSARPPTADRRTAIVLQDTFDQARTDAIMEWVERGGTLVVADPGSSLTQTEPYISPISGAPSVDEVQGSCDAIPALGDIERIRTGGSLVFDPEGHEPGAVACFTRDDGDWLVATPVGRGTVVALGGAGPFVNDNIDEEDAAGLAVALLAPQPGTATQVVSDLAPDAAEIGIEGEGGDPGLFAGLPGSARVAGIQLLVVFLFVALWRGRRLGRPVFEDPPVEIPGSELVVAVGDLYQKGHHRRRAAQALAARARTMVSDRLGLPRSADPRAVAEVTASRTGIPVDQVSAVVTPPDPLDDAALVALARATDELAARLGAPPPPTQEKT